MSAAGKRRKARVGVTPPSTDDRDPFGLAEMACLERRAYWDLFAAASATAINAAIEAIPRYVANGMSVYDAAHLRELLTRAGGGS